MDPFFVLLFYSDPSHKNDVDAEFQPIQGDKMHFIELNNDGLKTGINPHKESIDFWSKLEEKALQFANNIELKNRDEL